MSFSDIVKIIIQSLSESRDAIQVILAIVVIWSAFWAYRKFAYKETIDELKELKGKIDFYYQTLRVYASYCDPNIKKPPPIILDNEKIELYRIRNSITDLANKSLYIKKEIRDKIREIVCQWDSDNFDTMKYSKQEQDKKNAWDKFNSDYKEVINLIENEANKYILRK